jgi:hypothetical protein
MPRRFDQTIVSVLRGELDTSRLERRAHFAWSERRICEQLIEGEIFARTELLFGLSRATGPDRC